MSDTARLAALLHEPCVERWQQRGKEGYGVTTMHGPDAHGGLAARLTAAGVRVGEERLREALIWIADKADTFCPTCDGETMYDPNDGAPDPCFDSIHLISSKARTALAQTKEADHE